MAGDWIKWTKGLAKRPEVLHMATLMGRSRHEVAGLLCEFWEWADDNVLPADESAICPGFVRIASVSESLVDTLAGAVGFASAMSTVGWIIIRPGSLEFPKFGRHNGKSGKRRALDAERKRSKRIDEPDFVRETSALKADKKRTRGEERREEESPNGDSNKRALDDFETFWQRWPPKRRKSRGAAQKAWASALSKASVQVLLDAAAEYALSDEGRGEFVKMPSTWLNQECWKDDRAAWKRGGGKAAAATQERGERIEAVFDAFRTSAASTRHPERFGAASASGQQQIEFQE